MKFIPHDYQKHCIDKILELLRVGLFLDMGLGRQDRNQPDRGPDPEV